mmetsp:Transcript_15055/g.35665  ORF Transcript_15055/g.35665 Transcript_15055/m.35665 type:complete len:225 (-) Transcript_15055:310-984(-)
MAWSTRSRSISRSTTRRWPATASSTRWPPPALWASSAPSTPTAAMSSWAGTPTSSPTTMCSWCPPCWRSSAPAASRPVAPTSMPRCAARASTRSTSSKAISAAWTPWPAPSWPRRRCTRAVSWSRSSATATPVGMASWARRSTRGRASMTSQPSCTARASRPSRVPAGKSGSKTSSTPMFERHDARAERRVAPSRPAWRWACGSTAQASPSPRGTGCPTLQTRG